MTRTKIIGWTAMAVCMLGYGAMAMILVLGKMGHIDMTQAVLFGVGAGIAGEIGLWVAAGCLGFTIFKKRKALFDRLFRQKATEPTPQA